MGRLDVRVSERRLGGFSVSVGVEFMPPALGWHRVGQLEVLPGVAGLDAVEILLDSRLDRCPSDLSAYRFRPEG